MIGHIIWQTFIRLIIDILTFISYGLVIGIICRAVICVVCIVIDILTAMSYGLVILKIWGKSIYPNVEGSKQPILVMVHGSGADERQFVVARYLLHPLPIATLNLDRRNSCSIEHHAQHLAEFIEQLEVTSIILVGVSMGGLVSSYYAENHKYSVKILGIVTIGTPFQGAPLLNHLSLFNTVRHKEMTPKSNFLMTLADKVESSPYRYLTIGSQADIHVPDEYSIPMITPRHHTHITLIAPGHITLTIYPPIFTRYIHDFYHQMPH